MNLYLVQLCDDEITVFAIDVAPSFTMYSISNRGVLRVH